MSSLTLTPAAGGSVVTSTMKPFWRRVPRGATTRAPGLAAARQALGDGVEEGLVEGQGEDDPGEDGHFLPRRAMTFCMSSQTMRLSSRLPSFRTRYDGWNVGMTGMPR